jgi:hypothetical protein
MKKAWTLRFIQTAWVVEIAVLVIYTIGIVSFLEADRVDLWFKALPALGTLIGGQGAAASLGPLAADHIKTRKGGTGEHTLG